MFVCTANNYLKRMKLLGDSGEVITDCDRTLETICIMLQQVKLIFADPM